LYLLDTLLDGTDTWSPYLGKLTIDGTLHLSPNPPGSTNPLPHPDPASIITIDIASPSTSGIVAWTDGTGFDITFNNDRKFPLRTSSSTLTSQWVSSLGDVAQGGMSIPSVHSSISVDDENVTAGDYMLPGEKGGKVRWDKGGLERSDSKSDCKSDIRNIQITNNILLVASLLTTLLAPLFASLIASQLDIDALLASTSLDQDPDDKIGASAATTSSIGRDDTDDLLKKYMSEMESLDKGGLPPLPKSSSSSPSRPSQVPSHPLAPPNLNHSTLSLLDNPGSRDVSPATSVTVPIGQLVESAKNAAETAKDLEGLKSTLREMTQTHTKEINQLSREKDQLSQSTKVRGVQRNS